MTESVPNPHAESLTASLLRNRCWACLLGQHVGGEHEWISEEEDEVWLASTNALLKHYGFPEIPREKALCNCPCVTDLSLGPDTEPPDLDEVAHHSGPCPLCGEVGACGYDQEGRALIHALTGEDADV